MFCLTLLTAAEKVVVASQDKLLETNYMYYGLLETFKVFLPHNSLFLAIVREVAKNVAKCNMANSTQSITFKMLLLFGT